MKTFKKVLGVVLAIAMLAGVFSMMASAAGTDSAVDLYISTDKAVYSAGDTVVITVSEAAIAAVGEMQIGGTYAIGYPSAALEPISTSSDLPDHNFTALVAGYDSSISVVNFTDYITSQGSSIDAGAPWDSILGLVVCDDYTSIGSITSKTDLFTFEMKIKDTAPDGTYTIGFNADCYDNYYGYSNDATMGGIYGSHDDYGYGTYCPDPTDPTNTIPNNYGFNTCTFTVGAAGPVVAHKKAQVKMNLNAGKTALEGEQPIQLRVTSVITDSDFTTYFANTTTHGTDAAPTTSAITSVGIVAYKGAAASFDEATAKALVTNGTAATNYAAAETDYISNVGGEYTFGAIIKGSRADAFASDVTYLGFVKYLDDTGAAQIIFYDAAVTKTITDQTVSDYIAAMNA